MTTENEKTTKFREAVRLIDHQRRLLIEAHVDSSLVDAFDSIIRHLNSLSSPQLMKVVTGREHREALRSKNAEQVVAASKLTLDEIEAILSEEVVAKSKLEAIAVGRFQVPRGSLRSIGSIEKLREKIATLTRNERAHETISSIAQEKRY